VECIFDWFLHLLLVNWLWEGTSGILLGPLNRLLSVSNLFLIILENNWYLTSLGLLELLLWLQVSHRNLWLTEGSVDWVRLDHHGHSWNWVIVSWNLEESIVSNTGCLREGLSILVEVQLSIMVKGSIHSVRVSGDGLTHLFLSFLYALFSLLFLHEVLIEVIEISLKELDV